MSKINEVNFEDIIQVIVGASALSVPVAFSEESWNLSYTLPIPNIIFIILLSLLFVNLYSFQGIFQSNIKHRLRVFLLRTLIDYILTLIIVGIVLLGFKSFAFTIRTNNSVKKNNNSLFPSLYGGLLLLMVLIKNRIFVIE